MIVCRQCGQAAEQGSDFCAACGAYLEWEGEPLGGEGATGSAGAGAPATPSPSAAPGPPAGPPPGPAPSTRPFTPPSAPAPQPPPTPSAPPPEPASAPAETRAGGGRSGSVICLECGARNDDDRRFCRRCGSTLDLVALSGRSSPPDPAPSPPADPGAVDTLEQLGGVAAGGLVARPPSAPVPAPPSRVGARAPAVPPAVASPQAKGLQPTEPKARPAPMRPQRAAPDVPAGGPDCDQCGTSNPPGRRFCRRCGADLPADAAAPDRPALEAPRESWWRRLTRRFRRRERDGEVPTSSARSAYRRSLDVRFRVMRVLAGIAGLAVIAGGFGLVGLNPFTAGRDLWDRVFPRDERIGELQAAAAPEAEVRADFAPGAAVDGDPSTAWATTWLLAPDAPAAEGCVGSGADEDEDEDDAAASATGEAGGGAAALVISLPEATEVSKISVQPGLEAGDPSRAAHWQPTLLELRFDDGSCTEVELDDAAGFQDHRIDVVETATVRVSVLDAAVPRDQAASQDLVAVGEVRLFTPK